MLAGHDRGAIMMARSTFRAIGATALVGLFLAACSSTLTAPADSVAQSVRENVARDLGVTVDEAPPVTCPSSLEGVIGNSMVCTVEFDGEEYDEYDLKVTVTSVEDGNVLYDITEAD